MINSVNSINTTAVGGNDAAYTKAEAVIQDALTPGHAMSYQNMRSALASGPMTPDERASLIKMVLSNPSGNLTDFIPMIVQSGPVNTSQISMDQISTFLDQNLADPARNLNMFITNGLLTNINEHILENALVKGVNDFDSADLPQSLINFGNQHGVSISPDARNAILQNLTAVGTYQLFLPVSTPHSIFPSQIAVFLNDANFNNQKLSNSEIGSAIVSSFDKFGAGGSVKELLDYSKASQEPFTKDQINQMIAQANKANGPELQNILSDLNQY